MTEREGIKEVIIDGVRCPISNPQGFVEFSDLVRWPQKLQFGDPSMDDNDLLSSLQVSNLSGGLGVYDWKEGVDEGRFYMGTCYARFNGQFTKPPYAANNAAGSIEGTGNKWVLGEMWSDSIGDFIVIYMAGSGVRRGLIDGTSVLHPLTTSGVDEVCNNLANGDPVGPGVSFQGTRSEEVFFIPQGNNGYAVLIDTGTTLVEDTAYKFVSFTVWDNKLIGVTTGGRIYRCTDPGLPGTTAPTWTLYDVTYALSKSYRIRKVINYFDRRDQPCIFILTDRDMWQFDPDGPELFRIESGWPSHKYHAKAACVWNSQLFIATGMSVKRYTGGTWMSVGLDRDNGIPTEYQGHIVELVSGINGVYALVQGDKTDATYGGKSSIFEFNGSGWQCIWSDDSAVPSSIQYRSTLATTAYTVTGMCITQSGGVLTLVFSTAGSDDHMYTMPLSMEDANPRAGIGAGQVFGDGLYYYLELPDFDGGMTGYTNIGNAIQFFLEEPYEITVGDRDTFKVLYRHDREDWHLAKSTLAIPGRYYQGLGDPILGTSLTEGLAFEKIQFRFEIHRGATYNADKPMVMTNFVFSFLKTMQSNDAFTLGIETKNGSSDGRYSAEEFQDFLDGLTTIKRFTSLVVNGHTYRVYISQNKGTRVLGDSQAGIRQLSIVEIPETGFSV
jgi:hypothetical protein